MTIILLDPSSHKVEGITENFGDIIIKYHVEKLLKTISLPNYCWSDYGTNWSSRDTIVVAGANVFGEVFSKASGSVWHPNIVKVLTNKLQRVIPLGVGWWSYQNGPSVFTKFYYQKLLCHNLMPISVRDSYTLSKFQHMGFNNVYLTGCPSMYNHVGFNCTIPDIALITLTNYRKDIKRDLVIVNMVFQHFKNIYFFPQGSTDYDYLAYLCKLAERPLGAVNILDRSFEKLNSFLILHEVMHIGTRLHMGMHCLFFQRPSLCIEVDSRAIEMKKSFSFLPIVSIFDLPRVLERKVFNFQPPQSVRRRLDSFLDYAFRNL